MNQTAVNVLESHHIPHSREPVNNEGTRRRYNLM